MFTVTVGCDGSGKSSTCRPLSSWYSVMPSTVAIFFGSAARAAIGPATASSIEISEKNQERFMESLQSESAG